MKTIITMPMTIEPSDSDILLGRFKRSFNHPGNINFRTLINENVYLYMNTNTRREKGVVIKGLYNRLISQGRRFLKQHGKLWVDVSDDLISRDKVSHAIRDAVSIHFKNGILGNIWESAQQHPVTSKIKCKKRDDTNNFRKATAMMRTNKKKFPVTACDEVVDFEQQSLLPEVLQQRKDERGCGHDPFPFSTLLAEPCILSKYKDRCDLTYQFSSSLFSDTITVANSISIGLPSFHDVEYNSLDMTKNECLCRSAHFEPRLLQDQGVQDQYPTTGSLLSVYDILRNTFDFLADGEDFHTEARETSEDSYQTLEDSETRQWRQCYTFARG